MMMPPEVSVIVPNYQGSEMFPGCIRSLLAQDFSDFEIVFVDDGSTDGSLALCRKLFGKEKRVRIHALKKNQGYVGAINHGFRRSKGKYVVVTNNDATFSKNWVREMHATVKGKKNVIGSSYVIQQGQEALYRKALSAGRTGVFNLVLIGQTSRKVAKEELRKKRFIKQANGVLIIPRSALTDHIFLQQYYMYGEDAELCWRLRSRGYSVVLNGKAQMFHYGSFTRHKVKSFNKRAVFHGTKNTIQNFLVFYERKHLILIAPLFFSLQATMLLTRPREFFTRMHSFCWVMGNIGSIMRRRGYIQKTRTVEDKELFNLFSYRIFDEAQAPQGIKRLAAKAANAIARTWCRIFDITTFDLYDDDAIPAIDVTLLS